MPFLRAIALPVLAAFVIHFWGPTIARALSPTDVSVWVALNALRAVIAVCAGASVTRARIGGLRKAALAGLVVFVVDHVLLTGGSFLWQAILRPDANPHLTRRLYFEAFGGVLISFVMFSPVAMGLGFLGGRIGRRPDEARTN